MKIYDNFLSDKDYTFVSSALTNNKFPWYYNTNIAGTNEGIDGYQFVHTFFNVSEPYSVDTRFNKFLNPIWNRLSPKYMIRAKANLRPRTSEPVQSSWHTDSDITQVITGIFYIGSNNGYTVFKDGTKVNTVANRLILFDSQILHAGVSCTDQSTRIVLNLNYVPNNVLGKSDLYFPD
jgi:hypothetical protein